MNCPNCGKLMLRTTSGYCCEVWGCSRMQVPTKGVEYRPNTFRHEHGDKCLKCDGSGRVEVDLYVYEECWECEGEGCENCDYNGETEQEVTEREECPACKGTGIYTDPSRI